MLFGSRARGTARPKSDWDVAVLSRAESAVERNACRLLGAHERVNPIVLRPEAIEEYRDRATRLEAAIARQGRLLAGTWSRPECRMEDLEMDPDEFREDLEVAIRDIQNAVTLLCDAALDHDEYVPNLVELSQQAAEAVAKSIVAARIDAYCDPRAERPCDAARERLSRSSGGEERRRFAQAIRALNGNTRAAHGARYAGVRVEEPADTVERLLRVQRLQTRWIRSCAEQHPDMRAPARALGQRIARTAKRLERREGFDNIPPTVQSATRLWGDEGASIAEEWGEP